MLITKFSQMAQIDILVRWQSRSLGASIFALGICASIGLSASAEITAATGVGSTGTTFATTTPNTIDIQGGQKSSDNKNLFHSFGTFNVDAGQIANFKPDVGIQNILGRVTDGASLINGGIKVNGGSNTSAVNLFLMNPAGIVFGKGASLDINGAFTATTAKAIGFDNGQWFNALGANTYIELKGNPIGLAFPGSTPGSIVSAATLSNVKPGKSITLVGGTVISTGDIKTAGGNISIATVEGGKYVQIKADGSILRLDLPASATSITKEATAFTPLKLAELLTSPKLDLAAIGVKNENGVITLVGDPVKIAADINLGDTVSKQNRSILSGDVITRDLDTSIPNENAGNIYIKSSQAILSGEIDTSYRNILSTAPDNPKTGGNVTLETQTELKAKGINTSATNFQTGPKGVKGGNVTLSTQTKDIIVDSISTRAGDADLVLVNGVQKKNKLTKEEAAGFIGGNVTINATGLFRLINGGINSSIFGVIDINHGSLKPFAIGVEFIPVANSEDVRVTTKSGFTFLDGTSGSRGAITSSTNNNGSLGTVYKDQSIDGISIKGKTDTLPPKNPSNPDQQASKPKSRENCTPSSTSVASNPTAAPTRSAGNANAVSADPCQTNTSSSDILQILTDRN